MKNTLLATTALVAMTGAAAAELTISGTGRIGIRSTEGAAASVAPQTTAFAFAAGVANDSAFIQGIDASYTDPVTNAALATTAFTSNTSVTAAEVKELDRIIAIVAAAAGGTSTAAYGTAQITKAAKDLKSLQQLRKDIAGTTRVAAQTAKVADTTSGVNRFRISFTGTGETDSGISYGISGRAEQSDSAVAGSQYISGAFGKIKMGDLGGADKDAAGHIAGGVGVSGMGSSNEISYQAGDHNLGYEFSTNGLTLGYSQNTAVQTGSNSAMGIKWSGDMGGTGLTLGLGQSKVGTSTQSTMSVAVSMSGLTIKAISSTNDNGPATLASTEALANSTTSGSLHQTLVTNSAAAADTDHTGVSISYAMDAMSVTAYTKTVSTTGAADMDYSGIGIKYDMGGASLKAGMVDDNNITSMDLGISFSF